MTAANFQTTTSWLLVHEGGYVNNPSDPGGATNKGITQKVYDGYRTRHNLKTQSVRMITMPEVMDIYKEQYWNTIKGDLLPNGIDYAVYDFAVNSGPQKAIQVLQSLIGADVDGFIGESTLAAVQSFGNMEELIFKYCQERMKYVKTLRTFKVFGKGWTSRIMGEQDGVQVTDSGVVDRATKMLRGQQHLIIEPTKAFPGKADEEDVKYRIATVDNIANQDSVMKLSLGSLPATLSALAVVPDGPIQWALAGVLVIAALIAGIIILKKVMSRQIK